MTPAIFELLVQRFRDYTDRYRIDGKLHPMHQLKLEHTLRVAADARIIATDAGWPEKEICLAEVIGLFHDIARFPQFKQYQSFSDAETVDHGDLGAQTLENEKMLSGVPEEQHALILRAVQHHNKKNLPAGLSAHEEKHLRLVRDADRLDIFFICWNSIHSGYIHENPEIIMNVDFNGPPTDAVLDQFERDARIDYRSMKSMADRFILLLSWMHDSSYASTKRLIRERGVIEKFLEVVPVKTDRLMRCFEKTAAFLENT